MTTSPVEYDVYIAFNLKDDEAVREIAGRLKKAGVRAWLLEWHVSGSVGWSVKLEEALKRSASSALFVGSAGFDPPPNEEVLESIREREEKSGGSFRVIPVLLPGADVTRIPSFLFGKSWVNFRDGLDDENAFAMLLAGIRGVAPGARMGGRREPGGEAERTPASEDDEGAGDAVALSETSWPETFDEEEENSISVGGASETSGPLGHFMELSPVVQEQFGDEEQTALEIAGTMGFKAKHDVDSVLFLAALLGTAPRDLKHSGFYFLNVLRKHRGGDAEIDAVELLGLTEYDIISIPSDTEGSWGDVPATAELTDLCERAAEVATITKSNQGTVLTRHIIGAVLAPSASDNSSAALQQLEKQGYDTQALRSDFLSHIQKHHRTTYDDWQKILFPGAGRPADAAHAAAESQTREPAATTTPQPTPPPPAPETEAGRESIQQASISDQPSVKDTLGFAPYVKAIATFLNNEKTQPPLTLSVEGEWGSGKSSFMLQLAGELSEATRRRRWLAMRREARGLPFHRQLTGSPLPNFRRLERLMLRRRMRAEARRVKCLTVEFNPWRHDKEDALWASFALEFVRKLSEGMRRRERVVAYFRLLLRRFSWKGGWLVLLRLLFLVSVTAAMTVALVQLLRADGLPPWAEAVTGEDKNAGLLRVVQASGVAGYLAVALFFLSKFRELVGNPFAFDLRKYVETPDYEGRIAFIEQFHEDFNKIVETYAGRNKVYVFIDDLDRCDVPKAADLMQAINLMISGGAPQLIFVIGMDREKVAAGLAVKNEKLLPYLAQKAARTAAPAETRPAQSVAFGLEYGYNFIEKFIQIPFRVPQPAQMGVRQLLDFISPLVEDAADGGDKSQPPAVTPAAVAAPTPRDA
ncbi:MAG: P-loop NTPase fold protein, partial [Pyrinomonadaceae bacterium]